MRKQTWAVMIALSLVVTWAFSGCNVSSLIPIPPVELDLAAAGASEFQADAGTPVRKTVQFSAVEAPVDFSGGSIAIDPDAISVTPSDTTGGKLAVRLQPADDLPTCLEACDFAGVDATTCSNVCENGELAITVWVGSRENIIAECEDGDEYRFRVTLDEESRPVSVSVSPSSFQPNTRALLNAGSDIGLCIQVVSPVDATVLIDSLTLNLRL